MGARLSQEFEEEQLFSPFPWFDATRPYEFSLFTEEQMRILNGWDARWTRPEVSLEEFLRWGAAATDCSAPPPCALTPAATRKAPSRRGLG